jgi:hypothetical protein
MPRSQPVSDSISVGSQPEKHGRTLGQLAGVGSVEVGMKWYTVVWSLLFTYLCAWGFTAYMGDVPVSTKNVFWLLVVVGSLQAAMVGLEKIVRYRLGKTKAIQALVILLERNRFPTPANNAMLKGNWLPNSGAQGYFETISEWTKVWNHDSPLPEYVLLARDWMSNYRRLLQLAMSDTDAYAVDRFVEVGDEAVKQYVAAPRVATAGG